MKPHFIRYPYDITQQDCCRARIFNGNKKNDFEEVFSVQPIGVCGGAGGEVVVSEAGNPHNYLVVGNWFLFLTFWKRTTNF